jgi:Uncharacterised nucleotidyltransferase
VSANDTGASTEAAADVAPRKAMLRQLQQDLRIVTESLAGVLGSIHGIHRDSAWSARQWAIAPAVAAIHGVAALLPQRPAAGAPAAWGEFLAGQRLHISERWRRTQQLLQQLHAGAATAGIALLPLKGAALYAGGAYRPGERPMADVDLLVQPAQLAAAAQLLQQLGFHERSRTWRHALWQRAEPDEVNALGEHRRNPLKIELHGAVCEPLPLAMVEVSALLWPQQPQPGLNRYRSERALLSHLLLHAAGAWCARELRLLHLEDIARLTRHMHAGDWQAWHAELGTAPWWAFPPLQLVQHYYRCIPGAVLAASGAACRPWLRYCGTQQRLSDVSLSQLWVQALPGIEWARTPREAARYALQRLAPGSSRQLARRQLAQLQPRVSGGSWAQLSQGRRLLRWLTVGQARHETLAPVRAALQAHARAAQRPWASSARA